MRHLILSTVLLAGIVAKPINVDLLDNNFAQQFVGSTLFNSIQNNNIEVFKPVINDIPEVVKNIYNHALLQKAGLSIDVFSIAYKGYIKLQEEGKITNEKLTICDFSKVSGEKRMYVVDPVNEKLVLQTLVAHGKNSGEAFATSFGNENSSHKSSLGFYVTETAYNGANGLSLHLNGMDNGFNDRAYDRAVVIHGADYVSETMAETNGFIGRSFGCPAVARNINGKLINEVKEGSCLFIYYPSENYLNKSKWLN